jgi:N-acyl amino acid synthase of PEP-CTERM/exosortase system
MFDNYFEVFLADCPEGKEINYRTRYQVYCLETGYEDPLRFPNERETDEFDAHAAHFIVRARATGDWIAALRLVLGPLGKLPISRLATIDKDLLVRLQGANSAEDFAVSAEISRMCVVAQYRRRPLERHTPYQIPWDADDESSDKDKPVADERRKAPWLMLALLYAARDYSVQNGINHWFFLAARSLARIFKGLGMQLEQTGPGSEYRGIRFPHVIKIPSGFDNFELKYPKLAETIPTGIRYKRFSELEKHDYKIPAVM